MAWSVEVLDETVLGELNALPVKVRAALDKIIERIQTQGLHRVHEPHVKHLKDKLWEMRPSADGNDGRAIYVTASGQRVVIVAAFEKKTQKTPKRWLDLAEKRAKGAA